MGDLQSILFTKEVLFLSAAIVALLFFLGKIPVGGLSAKKKPKLLWNNVVWRRLLPIVPLFVGTGAAFAPGVTKIPIEEWGNIIVFGIWCGFVASHGRKILKRAILDKLEGKKE